MKKQLLVLVAMFAMLVLNGCSGDDGESSDIQRASLNDINTIYINHGSTSVNVESADIDELEAYVLLYGNKSGVVMDKEARKVSIEQKKDFTRLIKVGKKPRIEVRVPSDFKGEIIVEGTSGNVVGTDLQTHNLQINGKSGNVKLNYLEFHSDLYVTTKSGNVDVSLNEDKPNAAIHLKTNSGGQSVSLPLADLEQEEKETKGTSGKGDYEVKLISTSGNILLN
ncbi:DUF4097 family beta strand repeat-containing protein [Bacillus sp. JJ722]|uniref:DUF4097 family beta strand repeat-containing protein n=1 Tax=Bacillus sp. JJ722 TaxID=3122973 RepID=UPI003000A84A